MEAADAEALGRGMKALASRLARAVNRVFARSGRVLSDRYHLVVLKSPKQVRAALAYVLLNRRRHARRPRPGARCDPASSGHWFEGWRRPPKPPPLRSGGGTLPVSQARTRLLRAGWRRHGLIDPDEVPGRRGRRRG